MATIHLFPSVQKPPATRLRSQRQRRSYFTTGREEASPSGLWWLVDLLPSPKIRQPRPYRRPGVLAKTIVAFVVMAVIGFVLGVALSIAPNGDLHRPFLAAVRK